MKKLILLLGVLLFAKEVYFMPMQGDEAHKKLYSLFAHAHKSIHIAIYTFTDRKLARALKIAASRGVDVEIVADKKEAKYRLSQVPNLAKIKNIHIYLISGKRYYHSKNHAKMHAKVSIIDNKHLVIGSANYSYSAFYKNYEYIIFEKRWIKEFESFFNYLKENSTPYRLSY